MLCDVIAFHLRAPMPAIHVTCNVDHEKGVEWFSISMHACGSVPIHVVLRLHLAGVL